MVGRLLLIFALGLFATRCAARDASIDRAAPLAWRSLATESLVASGVDDPAQLNIYLARVDAWRFELRNNLAPDLGPAKLAEAIHRFMHDCILTGSYQSTLTNFAALIDQGTYNCVTATVLFLTLSDGCEIDAWAVELPGHVTVEVATDIRPLRVETTCRDWFTRSRQTVSVRDDLHSARVVDATQLLATFYHNRGVSLLDGGDYSAAIVANERALELDPACQPARDNLLAALNNWSVALAGQKRFVDAQILLHRGESLAPDYAPFQANRRYLERLLKADSP